MTEEGKEDKKEEFHLKKHEDSEELTRRLQKLALERQKQFAGDRIQGTKPGHEGRVAIIQRRATHG